MDKLQRMSSWMSQLRPECTSVPLWDLAIPGSHDSMTYCLDTNGPLEPNAPKWLKKLEIIFRHFIKRWATTQDLTISEQLSAGVRYFDMRIACKPKDGQRPLYFAHALYTTVTVEDTFKEVAEWLAKHPKEVIILSCKTFDGMNDDDHEKFIAQLKRIFSAKLCPKTDNPTLQDCWKSKYQVIFSYADKKYASNDLDLWTEIDYWWSTKDRTTAEKVLDYLDTRLKNKGRDVDKFFVAGLNLTENEKYVLEHPYSSMRKMTYGAYPQLLDWVSQQHCGSAKTCINIIAADFVDPEFVQLVIDLNIKK
ncbi:hypothetical protein ACEWY4_017024 [Coilia grayii]|uniref:Phosphatidylinositol-specific phospholipase C X domain-containing protein n=1 Tax=Coilia grayii TaxID=363190 RepID=A0ABD1JM06_9TELE